MSEQRTLLDTPSGISSPELEDGRGHCDSPDGRTTGPSGPEAPHASPSPQPDGAVDTTTPGTSPRHGSILSASAALQSSLENRLQARLTARTPGSMIYRTTWKRKTTPRGRSYCQLVASAPRISASDSGLSRSGWVTASSRDWKDTAGMATTATNPDGSSRTRTDQLPRQAALAGWPTPDSHSASGGRTPKDLSALIRPTGTKVQVTINHAAALAGWPTARSADAEKNVRTADGSLSEIQRKGSPQDTAQAAAITGPARITASGQLVTGSTAGTTSGGQLNPALSRWLMGYPEAWCQAAIRANRAMPTKQPKRA